MCINENMHKKQQQQLTNALLIVSFGIADVLKFKFTKALSKLLLGQWKLCKSETNQRVKAFKSKGKWGIALFVDVPVFPLFSFRKVCHSHTLT